MWISKKKYNELVEQKQDFERIASNAVAQNGRLLDHWKGVMEEMHDIQRFNHVLVDRNEELVAMVDEMRSALDTARRQVEELEHQLTETEIDLWDAQATAEAYKTEKEVWSLTIFPRRMSVTVSVQSWSSPSSRETITMTSWRIPVKYM